MDKLCKQKQTLIWHYTLTINQQVALEAVSSKKPPYLIPFRHSGKSAVPTRITTPKSIRINPQDNDIGKETTNLHDASNKEAFTMKNLTKSREAFYHNSWFFDTV